MIWWVIGIFIILVAAWIVLAFPFGPAQPLWMDIRDWVQRRFSYWDHK